MQFNIQETNRNKSKIPENPKTTIKKPIYVLCADR